MGRSSHHESVTGLKSVSSTHLQAIDEGSLDALDHSDFLDTDIPFEVPIPTKLCVTVRQLFTKHVPGRGRSR